VESGGKFDDRVAYGGWPMDDHHPDGFYYPGAPTIFYGAPSPYGIPYRCLYSKNIANLFFAGRNISATHMALSSTRVIGTCSILGQAVGTAAAMAIEHGVSPREIGVRHISVLQQRLMDQDLYLPWMKRDIPALCRNATLEFEGENGASVLDGVDRDLAGESHAWIAKAGQSLSLRFQEAQALSRCRIVFDSDFSLHKRMPCSYPADGNQVAMPATLVRDFSVETMDATGKWRPEKSFKDQFLRCQRFALSVKTKGVRLRLERSWGNEAMKVFAFEVS
jgi:hypothetical protein